MTLGFQLEVEQTFCHHAADFFVHTDWAEDMSDFTFNLSVATALDAGGSRLPLVSVVIPFSLGCQETPNAHGYRSGNELCDTSQHDEPRIP